MVGGVQQGKHVHASSCDGTTGSHELTAVCLHAVPRVRYDSIHKRLVEDNTSQQTLQPTAEVGWLATAVLLLSASGCMQQ